METVEWHIRQMEDELRQWGVRLDKLMDKADDGGGAAKIDYRKRLDDLSAKYATAEARLTELRAAGTSKWDAYRDGVESAWSELATAFTKLAN
jgi:hypothetical protein